MLTSFITSMSKAIIFLLIQYVFCQFVYANNFALSLTGGISSAEDPEQEDQANVVNVQKGDNINLGFHILQGGNLDGGLNYYDFLISYNAFDVNVSNTESNTESDTNYQIELEALHLHIGGSYGWRANHIVHPYFLLSLGLSEYDNSDGFSDSFPSISVGGGSNIQLLENFFLKVEARAHGTVLDRNTHIFCRNNTCSVFVAGRVWWQPQLSVGLSIHF